MKAFLHGSARRARRRPGVAGVAALGLAVLAGCSAPPRVLQMDPPPASMAEALEACCAYDSYPQALVDVAVGSANSIVPFGRSVILRKAWLQDIPEVEALILGQARPLDLIEIANRSHLSGAVGGGYFGHVVIYTGTEAQLRALGVWDDPAVARFHERIRAGGIAIESIDRGVRLANAHQALEADGAALFRAEGFSRAARQRAVINLFAAIGRPFDNQFDLVDRSALYCTELLAEAMPELNLPVRISYGRPAIWPDEVATASLLGKTGYRFVTYVHGTPLGWREESWQKMAGRILGSW